MGSSTRPVRKPRIGWLARTIAADANLTPTVKSTDRAGDLARCHPHAPRAADGWAQGVQLAAGRVLAVAAELDPVPRRFAVFATVLAEGTMRLDETFAWRVRTLFCFSHSHLLTLAVPSVAMYTLTSLTRVRLRLTAEGPIACRYAFLAFRRAAQ